MPLVTHEASRPVSRRRPAETASSSALPPPRRRKKIDPTTCEREYRAEEIEFMRALDSYKRASGRMFPTCSEILEVVQSLGYRRSATA